VGALVLTLFASDSTDAAVYDIFQEDGGGDVSIKFDLPSRPGFSGAPLRLGTNRVTGNLSGSGFGGGDVDVFEFEILPGQKLESISLHVENYVEGGLETLFTELRLTSLTQPADFKLLLLGSFGRPNTFQNPAVFADFFADFVDAPPGEYYTQLASATSYDYNTGYYLDYTLDYVVTPIPAPIALFGTGLAVLGVLARRRRRA